MKEGTKILIADDNDLMRMIMKNFSLELFNSPKTVETVNLSSTYAALKADDFDFLILDINMPNGDATPDEVRNILGVYPKLKICMFSGNPKSALAEIYREAGAVGFIQKDENLRSALGNLIKQYFN